MIPNFRQSISTNNMLRACPYQFYLTKIAEDKPSYNDMQIYGDSGTCVHSALERYFEGGKPNPEKLDDIKKLFDQEWVDFRIVKLNKTQYWECVLNGIASGYVPSITEEFVNAEAENYSFVAKIDARKDDEWVLDYKTSTFSIEKVQEYFHQLIGYAFSIRKKHGFYPKKLIVMFLKEKPNSKNFIHELTFDPTGNLDKSKYYSEDDVYKFVESLPQIQKDYSKRVENCDWPKGGNDPRKMPCLFCGFQEKCLRGSEFLKINLVNVNNDIYMSNVDGSGFPPILINKINERLSYELKDKEYAIKALKEKTGRDWDGVIHLFNMKQFSFKRGLLDEVKKVLNHYANAVRKNLIINEINVNEPLPKGKFPIGKLNFPHDLYQYQKEAVTIAKKKKVGIIKLPTGSGKTVIAADLIRQLNTNTLFVIDNLELLEQTKEEYQELLGINIGTITEGQFNPDKVTVSTIQTITRGKNNVEEIQQYLNTVNLIILDECHIIASDSFKYLNKYLIRNEYCFGFSATPFRTDGHDMLLEERCGKIIFERSIDDLAETGLYAKPEVIFHDISAPINKPFNKIINEVEVEISPTHHDYYDRDIVNNEERNNKIKQIVEQNPDKQIMIVASKIEHMEILNKMIEGSKLIYGSTKKEDRKQILQDFKDCKFRVLVANITIMYKGLNIHSLEILVNAAANNSEITTTQLIGRLLRRHPENKPKQYIDFIDKGEHFGRYINRHEDLKNLGFIK